MAIATISSKGQITLPAQARRALGLQPHDRVSIGVSRGRIVIERARDFFELRGFLGKSLTAEKEKALMMEGMAVRHGRKR